MAHFLYIVDNQAEGIQRLAVLWRSLLFDKITQVDAQSTALLTSISLWSHKLAESATVRWESHAVPHRLKLAVILTR
jgi:hypothetical protein